jgi:hypothetical protein
LNQFEQKGKKKFSTGYVKAVTVKDEETAVMPAHIRRNPLFYSLFKRTNIEDGCNVCVVVGDTGSGKSTFALANCINLNVGQWTDETTNETRWVSRFSFSHICYSVVDLVKITTNDTLPRGTNILYDEAGVESDNTSYNEMRAKLLRWVLATWRYRNMTLWMTLPTYESLQAGLRRLTNMLVECTGFNGNNGGKIANVYWLKRKTGVTHDFKHSIRYRVVEDGFPIQRVMRGYEFFLPDEKIVKEYKRIKHEKTSNWYTQFNEELKTMEDFFNKGGRSKTTIALQTKDLFDAYVQRLPELLDYKGAFSNALVEKLLVDDKIEVSPPVMAKLKTLLRAEAIKGNGAIDTKKVAEFEKASAIQQQVNEQRNIELLQQRALKREQMAKEKAQRMLEAKKRLEERRALIDPDKVKAKAEIDRLVAEEKNNEKLWGE